MEKILNRNRADWEHFKIRGPVNFMRPRAQQCRINQLIVSWLIKDEAIRLLSATTKSISFWRELCVDIEIRLVEEKIISVKK